ncbi:MAG: flagellar basal body P-ring protein FlgI [Planctomycetota bacterium]
MNKGNSMMRHSTAYTIVTILTLTLLAANTALAQEVRIKDITHLDKVRDNQLTGIGLVTGLNGTGDGTAATKQAMVNLLRKENLNVDPNEISSGNVALVLVTATLPPYARKGDEIDVTVTSIGDSTSLFGGVLVQMPLKAATGDTYAVGQGPVSIGGFSASGGAASMSKNHSTVGTIPDGAIVEREVPVTLMDPRKRLLTFKLKIPDFATASRVAEAINKLHKGSAIAKDMKAVEVKVPRDYSEDNLISFVAGVQALTLIPDMLSKVIINERTGTIVAGSDVRVSTVAITHGNLIITIAESPEVSQPLPFSKGGETVTVDRTDLNVSEEAANFTVIPSNSSVADLAMALNAIGATPRDLVVIFQLIKKAGALHAELEIM